MFHKKDLLKKVVAFCVLYLGMWCGERVAEILLGSDLVNWRNGKSAVHTWNRHRKLLEHLWVKIQV